jgi:hypothetical protein
VTKRILVASGYVQPTGRGWRHGTTRPFHVARLLVEVVFSWHVGTPLLHYFYLSIYMAIRERGEIGKECAVLVRV